MTAVESRNAYIERFSSARPRRPHGRALSTGRQLGWLIRSKVSSATGTVACRAGPARGQHVDVAVGDYSLSATIVQESTITVAVASATHGWVMDSTSRASSSC